MGISFLDKVRTLETFKKITFHKIIYPTLFLPFLSRSSDIIGKKILLKFEKNIFSLNFNVNISSNFQKKGYPSIAKKAEVIFLENKDSFTEKEWKNLYKLSENTFVEETESLKQGAAGAGLTDNDLEEKDSNDLDDICDECKEEHESVTQNLILTGFKICKSCRISKTIFPI